MSDYDEAVSDWSDSVARDFVRLFCGKLLGNGMSRQVFVLETDPTKVVKVEAYGGYFQNVREWEAWKDLGHTKYGKYIAPCVSISPNGSVLVQERVEPITPDELRAARLPSFLCDFKATNYGRYKGRIVCCDYGTNLLHYVGAEASKLRKPAKASVFTG